MYELGQAVAGQPKFYLRDVNEDLNPDNPSSPYVGQILPYRPICWLGTWPQVAGNLLNSGAWRVPFDPGFESSTVGAKPAWITAVGGTAPVVGTSTPHGGSRDLTYTVLGTATVQGASLVAYTMPGTQYTVSAYVRQSSASTQGIYAAGSVGTTTTTTGAYVRLTKTFTATDITTVLAVQTSGTAVAGTVLIDDLQLEEGAAASAWTSTGPVVYPLFNGFCERFERAWPSSGFEGEALVTGVDSLAALNAISLGTEYPAALLATSPDHVWALTGGTGSTVFPDQSGNAAPSLSAYVSKFGAGTTPVAGTPIPIPGDAGVTGVAISTPSANASFTQAGTFLAGGPILGTGYANLPAFPAAIGTSWSVSIAAWAQFTGTSAPFDSYAIAVPMSGSRGHAYNIPLGLFMSADPGTAGQALYQNVTTTAFSCSANANVSTSDGLPHLYVGTITQDTVNTTIAFWIDGVLQQSNVFANSSLGGMLSAPAVSLCVGGSTISPGFVNNIMNGSIVYVAQWNRVLSSTEIAALWTAGGLGFAGETSGARVARHLTLGGYAGTSRISAGSSIMGPPSYEGNIRLLADTQNTVVAEGGCLWAAQDGAIVFEGRQDRWLRLTPVATFGENAAGGEIVYEPDFSLSQDPQYLFADVQITQSNGPTAIGGRTADIATAAKRFFGRPYAATVDLLNVADVQSLADWTFYTHNRPLTRAAVVRITPARGVGTAPTAPGTWAQALSLEIGQRVRATRRAKAGNSGAGVTVTLDYFIEAVTFDNFDADSGEFDAYFLLSPIGSATVGTGVTFQPWILGDATYGVLGSTTVLGW